MNERPILFSAPMVRAILDGRKTVTRRIVKPVGNDDAFVLLDHGKWFWPYRSDDGESSITADGNETPHSCPYGQPGDRLWVREAFSGPHCMDASDGCKAVPPSKWGDCSRIWYWADGNPTEGDWTRPRPSIHMPRWASRITLEIVSVRVERLQDISYEDALAEGVLDFRQLIEPECQQGETSDEFARRLCWPYGKAAPTPPVSEDKDKIIAAANALENIASTSSSTRIRRVANDALTAIRARRN